MSINSDDDKPFSRSGRRSRGRKHPRELPPLTQEKLRAIAIRYVERYQTTQARLERLLRNKLRLRGWEDTENPPDIDAISAHMVELGYVDDSAFAEARTRGLAHRGFGAQRIRKELTAAGVDEGRQAAVLEGHDEIASALAFARRKRIGPFGKDGPLNDPRVRQRQMAAMARAGHSFELARKIVDAKCEDDLPEEEY